MLSSTLSQELFVCQGPSLGYRDLIPGGRADGVSHRSFNRRQLAIGTKVEMEHTTNRRMAKEIAADHLFEDPDYYTKLATIHLDGLRGLGDFRSEFVGKFAFLLGGEAKANELLNEFELLVEQRAAVGAAAKVKPMITSTMALAGVGLVLGAAALVVAIRK